MKQRQEVIALLGESELLTINDFVTVSRIPSDEGAIQAIVKVEQREYLFRLWSHYNDISDFYSDSFHLRDMSDYLVASKSLLEALSYDMEIPNATIVSHAPVTVTDTATQSKLEVYESIFRDHGEIVLKK